MKYARIEQNVVRETIELPEGLAPSGIFANAQDWVQCPYGAAEGWVVLGGEIVPVLDLKVVMDKIDAAAGAARARYLTIAPGQEATYMYKSLQAAEYKAAGYSGPAPLFVQAEADAIGCTAAEACDLISAQADAWLVKGSQIEGVRRKWKLALEVSTDKESDLALAMEEFAAL